MKPVRLFLAASASMCLFALSSISGTWGWMADSGSVNTVLKSGSVEIQLETPGETLVGSSEEGGLDGRIFLSETSEPAWVFLELTADQPEGLDHIRITEPDLWQTVEDSKAEGRLVLGCREPVAPGSILSVPLAVETAGFQEGQAGFDLQAHALQSEGSTTVQDAWGKM